MEPTAAQLDARRIWVAALESDRLPQGRGSLGDITDGFCCLGLGCYVLGIEYDPSDSFPPQEFCNRVGLPHDEELIGVEIEAHYDGGNLVNDNDGRMLSFPEIAQVIKTSPSLWSESAFQQAKLEAIQAEIDEFSETDEDFL